MTQSAFSSPGLDPSYRRLARSLDALPNRFPWVEDGSDLRLLAYLFTPEEAALAADLLPELETLTQIASRLERDPRETGALLKELSKKGLIVTGKTAEGRLGFGIKPFVVGFYEEQVFRMDAELARLFEDYYRSGFGKGAAVMPAVHRVIPVRESVKNTMEVQPFESVTDLLEKAQSWGVLDCICRKQKALIGQPCGHPVDVCMAMSTQPEAFSGSSQVRSLTLEQALGTLKRAADAGLVHCVSNNQRDVWYICNCCTCSCGVLRGIAELGIADVVARSAFVNRVDEDLCTGCGECLSACPFNALSVEMTAQVLEIRCEGCGLCVRTCPQGALGLVRRAGEALPPVTEEEWRAERRLVASQGE